MRGDCMPNLMLDLVVDRVDLVDEGANSEAFIKLYKRKENNDIMNYDEVLAKMKQEHADIIRAEIAKAKAEVPQATTDELAAKDQTIAKANEDVAKAKEELSKVTAELETVTKAKEADATVEDVIKSLDPAVQEVFKSLKTQKEAAEAVVKQLNEKKLEDEAIAKAKDLKALPVEEAKLVTVVKGVSDEVYEILKSASVAIEAGGLLEEVGKGKGESTNDAWSKIEKKADAIADEEGVTKQKAIAKVIQQNPDLYREYLKGGAN